VGDVFILRIALARPGHVLLAGGEGGANRVQAANEFAVAEGLEHVVAHAGHDPHVHDNIR
jgi:hypothetical protein